MRTLLPILLATAVAGLAPTALAATPKAADLLKRSAAALEKKDGLHIEAAVKATAQSDGSLTEAQIKKLFPPTEITLKGDVSQKTIVVAASMVTGEQVLAGELRTSGAELYVKFGGAWYGTKNTKAKGSGLTIDASPKQLSGSVSDLLRSGLEVKVAEGPKVDGVATWELTGTFDPKAMAKLTKKSGADTGSIDLTQLAGKTDVTLLIGRDDSLLRRIEIVSTLAPKDITAADSSTGGILPLPASGAKGLKSETISVIITLSRFGEKIPFERPAALKPLDKLFEELLGGLNTKTK